MSIAYENPAATPCDVTDFSIEIRGDMVYLCRSSDFPELICLGSPDKVFAAFAAFAEEMEEAGLDRPSRPGR